MSKEIKLIPVTGGVFNISPLFAMGVTPEGVGTGALAKLHMLTTFGLDGEEADTFIEALSGCAGHNVITYHPGFRESIPEEFFRAMILHEQGHIELGHADQASAGQIVLNQSFELAADKYAAERSSPGAVLGGLQAAIEFALKGAKKLMCENVPEEEQAEVWVTIETQAAQESAPRIAALRAMIR